MQGFKKSLVALLAVAMVFSLVGTAFAAVPADVEGTQYEDAAIRLIALGVFKGDDKGNFNPEDAITRAEAVAIIIRALGLEKSADLMKGVTKFADVNADAGLQWATGAINIAVSSGIVNGYPDGNFGGRDNVTYAQLAKMILYALNYGVTVEGGVWPTAVLAKADDLGVLDGLSVVADAPINRGFAAEMLDNSLDIASLKQTGYGDLKQYEETGKTLLEKMGLDEVEGRVVLIPEVDNALDDDEVVIEVTKENGEDLKDAKEETYTELEGVDVQGLFGLKVRAWIKDDEVVFVENKTADNDIYNDTIDSVKDIKNDKVDLVILDDDVTFADDATIYLNYKTAKLSDLKDGYFGRFVKDKNKIVFANVFNFGANEGVVTEVDDLRIKYFKYEDTERTLNLTKADSITVFNADLTKADFEDIEKDSVISWWKSSDDYYIVLVNEKVEGKLTRVKDDKVTIDGKAYNIKKNEASFSLGDDDDIEEWEGDADKLDDLYDEEVTALLNLKGHVRHLRGSVDATSGTQYGIVTASTSDSKITVFTKDGEEVTYELDKRGDWGVLRTPKGELRYYGTGNELGYYVLSYKVKADESIAKSEGNVGVKNAVSVSKANPTEDDIVKLDEQTSNVYKGQVVKAKKDWSYITIGDGGAKYYIDSKTVVMRAVSKDKELDPELIKWEDFKDLVLNKDETTNMAVVFGEPNKDAKAIIFVDAGFVGTTDDTYYGVMTDKPWKEDGDWYAEIDVFEEGIGEYQLDSKSDDHKKGALVEFTLNAKGEASVDVPTVAAVKVEEVDGNYIKLGTKWYKVESDVVVYEWNVDDNKLGDKWVRSDIEEDDHIRFVGKDEVIKAAILYKGEVVDDDDDVGEGVVTYINATRIFIDGERYAMDEDTVLYDTDGKTILLVGGKEIATDAEKQLVQNDIVKVLEVKNGVIVEMKLVERAAEKEAVEEALETLNEATVTGRDDAYTALMKDAETLGLNVGEGSDFDKLVENRAKAAAKDLFDNMPKDGYTLEDLQAAFDEIVETRMVFEESVALFAKGSKEKPLEDLEYITMLIDNLKAAKYQTIHSGRNIDDDILPELETIVKDFGELTEIEKEAVLKYMDYEKTTSSTATRNAIKNAIAAKDAHVETWKVDALKAVNKATSSVMMRKALEDNAEILELEIPADQLADVAAHVFEVKGEGYEDLEALKAAIAEVLE